MLVLCTSPLLFARAKPDFSGVYLRESEPILLPAIPGAEMNQLCSLAQVERIFYARSWMALEVAQSRDTVEITRTWDGTRSFNRCFFHGDDSRNSHQSKSRRRAHAKIKGNKLMLEYSRLELTPMGAVVAVPVQEIWELSSAGSTLTIRNGSRAQEIYVRQPSLEAALERASKPSETNTCACVPASMQAQASLTYKSGVALGITFSPRSNGCRIMGFEVGLGGDFFKDLERHSTAMGTRFLKSDQEITTFSEDIFAEVSLLGSACGHQYPSNSWPEIGTSAVPAELSDLRFQVKWIGSSVREVGEVPAELLTEPWTEMRAPEHFYRLQIPSQGVPLTDTLEIRILSHAGEELACIRGHI